MLHHNKAIKLVSTNFNITTNGIITPKHKRYFPTDAECTAIDYLCDEYGYEYEILYLV